MGAMRLIHITGNLKSCIDKSVVTIGNFDGVHRGHVEVFQHVKQVSNSKGLPSVVLTFKPHPLEVLAPESAPPMITTFDQKAALIAAAGIENLVVIEFDVKFSRMSAESFVQDVLCGCLGMKHIIIGHDYAFGRDRQGDFETLTSLGKEHDFTLEDLEPVGIGDTIFSSSLARRRIASGDMFGAAEVLGRYHTISGLVVHGRQIGSTLGFPTANIETHNKLIPPDGVYAVMVALDGCCFQGVCNIGTNQTFGSNLSTIEVFLFDFSGDLYNRELVICFVQRLREGRKFPDAETLIRAISLDVAASRTVLSSVQQNFVNTLYCQQSGHF
jgi:riboflavin kinase/FMN adenylyltransferase